MKTVNTHRYASEENIKLMERPDSMNPIARLTQGTWIGVMEQVGEWLRVITSEGYGWIKAEQTLHGDGYQLRVLPGINGKITYSIN